MNHRLREPKRNNQKGNGQILNKTTDKRPFQTQLEIFSPREHFNYQFTFAPIIVISIKIPSRETSIGQRKVKTAFFQVHDRRHENPLYLSFKSLARFRCSIAGGDVWQMHRDTVKHGTARGEKGERGNSKKHYSELSRDVHRNPSRRAIFIARVLGGSRLENAQPFPMAFKYQTLFEKEGGKRDEKKEGKVAESTMFLQRLADSSDLCQFRA